MALKMFAQGCFSPDSLSYLFGFRFLFNSVNFTLKNLPAIEAYYKIAVY